MAVYNRENSGPKIKNIKKGAEKRIYDSFDEEKHKSTNANELGNTAYDSKSGSRGNSNPFGAHVNDDSSDIPIHNIKHGVGDKFNRTLEILSGIPSAIKNRDSYTPELNDALSQTARDFGGAVRSGIIMPTRQIQYDIGEGMSGGMQKAHEYRMMKDVSSLGASLVIDAVMQANNSKVISNINAGKGLTADNINDRITVQGLKDTHNVLYKTGITKNEKFKLRSEKDLRNLTNLMDAYSMKEGRGKLSKMDNPRLEKLKSNLLNKNDQSSRDLLSLVDQRLKINKTVSTKGNTLERNHRNIRKRFKKAAFTPINSSEFYRGYLLLNQTKAATKTTIKATMLQGKMMYKGTRFVLKTTSKSSQFVLRKTGNSNLIKVADGIQHLTNGIGGVANFGEKSISSVMNIPKKLRTSLDIKKTIMSDRIKNTPQIIRRSKVYKNASRTIRTTKVGKKVRSVKWRTKKVTRVLGKTKVGKAVKATKRVAGKTLSAPKKLLGSMTRGFSALFSAVKAIFFKVVLILIGFVLISSVVISAAAGVITTLTAIGDAVSNSYEEFCANTAMGKAYQKLLTYEKTFFESVGSLYSTQAVSANSDGYAIQGIYNYGQQYTLTKYDGEIFEVVDGNGNELLSDDMYNTKAILALAAIYIDQDFSKYSGVGGVFGGIYQDYCERLYKNSHMAFIEVPAQSDVYYCADYDHEYGGSKAASDCTNKTNIDHGTWTSESDNPPSCEYYTSNDVYSEHSDEFDSWTEYEYTEYTCKGHDYCCGHINAKVKAVVSTAYLPEDYDKLDGEITETNNNLYNVDGYGNAYMYEDSSDSPLGNIASMALNISNGLFSVPLSLCNINFGDEIVDNVAGITVYYSFKNEKTNELGEEYKFKTHFGEPNRNFDGWNDDNIARARLLIAGDWKELYKIDFETDFAGIEFDTGSGFDPGGGPISGEYLGEDVGIAISNYYNQGDYAAYKMTPGCSSTIKTSGCGFCSLAMVANTLTGDPKYTPLYVVNQLAKDFYVCGAGGAHSLPTAGAARFGLTGRSISLSSQSFADVIDSGGLVIALIGNPHPKTEFYGGKGHYIVIRGVTESGKIVVADPGKRANNSRAWPINQLRLRMAWSITN